MKKYLSTLLVGIMVLVGLTVANSAIAGGGSTKNISITFSGTGTGSVQFIDSISGHSGYDFTCTTSCTNPVGNNDNGTLVATAGSGSVFVSWSATDSGIVCTGNTCTVAMPNSNQAATVTFNLAPLSSDTSLSALSVSEGTLTPGFSASTFDYSVTLPFGTVTIPEVFATTTDSSATKVIIQPTDVNGVGTVVVTAEDGTTRATTTVKFSVADPDIDTTLSELSISSGTLTPAFTPGNLTYSATLPFGTVIPPTVFATSTATTSTVYINQTASTTGTATVLVTAQSGATTTTTITFSVNAGPSSDASLSALSTDGILVPGFNPSTFTYNVSLAYNTTITPVVLATTTDGSATTTISDPVSVTPGSVATTTVTVTAEDSTVQIYYVVFTVESAPSSDSSLSALSVIGHTLVELFSPSLFNYNVILPFGTTVVPETLSTTTSPHAMATTTNAISISAGTTATTTVDVLAEDLIASSTYRVVFSVSTGSSDATLSGISVSAGSLVPPFSSSTYLYSVELPFGTTDLPVVGATTSDGSATTTITQATSTNGTATILVTAQDATTTQTYTVTFSVAETQRFTLVYLAGDNGTLTGTTTQTVNQGESGTAVTAVANSGYHFVNWSDGSATNPRTDTNVQSNATTTANFERDSSSGGSGGRSGSTGGGTSGGSDNSDDLIRLLGLMAVLGSQTEGEAPVLVPEIGPVGGEITPIVPGEGVTGGQPTTTEETAGATTTEEENNLPLAAAAATSGAGFSWWWIVVLIIIVGGIIYYYRKNKNQ